MRFAGRTHVSLHPSSLSHAAQGVHRQGRLRHRCCHARESIRLRHPEDAAGDTDAPDTDVFDTEVDTGGPELEDDGPTGWLTVDVGSNADFHAVHFVDEMTGWIGAIHMGFAPRRASRPRPPMATDLTEQSLHRHTTTSTSGEQDGLRAVDGWATDWATRALSIRPPMGADGQR